MANNEYEVRGAGDFCPTAALALTVQHFDTVFQIINPIGFEDEPLEVGMAALIDEEIVRVTAIGADMVEVARGCADTIPAVHSVGAIIWFYEDTLGGDEREYAGGETISAKIMPQTSSDRYPIELAPPKEITMNWRFARPYPPGQMGKNGIPWFEDVMLSADEPSITLTWAHRNRVTQSDQLVDHFEPPISPEPGTTYFAVIYRPGETEPRRTELGITGSSWTYHWSQAVVDLDFPVVPEGGDDLSGWIRFGSMRDGLESWQTYGIPFTLNNTGMFLRVAQLGELIMQKPTEIEGFTEQPVNGLFAADLSMQMVQEADISDGYSGVPVAGIFVSQLVATTGQETAIFTPMARALFEAPYTFSLRHEGVDPLTARVLTVGARPSDRLSDSQTAHSRIRPETDQPALPFSYVGTGGFTPWLTIDARIEPLDRTVAIRTTSLFDGVPLTNVHPGQMAMLNAEIVRVEDIDDLHAGMITFERGCVDTTPARHGAGSRIWFFEAGAIMDATPWPRPPVVRAGEDKRAHLEYKLIPNTVGIQPSLADVATDRLPLDERKWRPFPPGRVRLNGQPWYLGAMAEPDKAIIITWAHRNRITQGRDVIDHNAPSIEPEPGTRYRLSITVSITPRTAGGKRTNVVLREAWVEGSRFDYTYDMAFSDGHRASRLFNTCGFVSVSMRLDAYVGELDNWQGYSFMLRLPAPVCPTGKAPGGGSSGGGQPPGRGNGTPGATPGSPGGSTGGGGSGSPGSPGSPGGADDPALDDPFNNSGGSEGGGPRPPDPPPEGWPGDVSPSPFPNDPGDPVDENDPGRLWDMQWDHFWAAGGGDDPGDDEGED